MGVIKKLAGQTAVYGLSSIIARFLNYLLTPFYTYLIFKTSEYGVVSEMYAYAGFLTVLYLYGMETAFFRFAKGEKDENVVFSTSFFSLTGSSLVFSSLLILFSQDIANILEYPQHQSYVIWFASIFALDAIAAIPFARLRWHEKAVKYAIVKVVNILANILLNVFFLYVCPKILEAGEGGILYQIADAVYNPAIKISYVFISNLCASAITLLLLLPQIIQPYYKFLFPLWKKMLQYALPLMIVGFAGIVNEMLDRILLKMLLPYNLEHRLELIGIYSACYKLSILMTLFIQAFRMAVDPFFFAHSDREDAKSSYAQIMKYFVIAGCVIFLLVLLYIDVFEHFIGPDYRSGLKVVPILLMANLFLGIYYNLSVWYKLKDRTLYATFISVGGALITILLNIWWIPLMGYVGSAWATLVCYVSMTAASYFFSRKYYPVPYPVKRIVFYLVLSVIFYLLSRIFDSYMADFGKFWVYFFNSSLFLFFIVIVWLWEKPVKIEK